MEQRTGLIPATFFLGVRRAWDGKMQAYTRASPAQGHHRHGPRYFNLTYSARRVALRTLAFWLLLVLTFGVLVAKPEKCTLHGGQSRSSSAEHRNDNRESLAAHLYSTRCSFGENQIKSPYASIFLDGTQVLVSLTPVQESFGSSTWANGCRFATFYASMCDNHFPSLLACLLFPPRDYGPPPTLHDRLNLHLSLQCRRFQTPRYAKRAGVAWDATGPLFSLPTLSSSHCTLRVSERDSLRQPHAAHSDEERPRPQKSGCAQRCLNACTAGYFEGTVIRD